MLMRIKRSGDLVVLEGNSYTYLDKEVGGTYQVSPETESVIYSGTYKLSDMEPATKLSAHLLGVDLELEAAYNEGRKGESND